MSKGSDELYADLKRAMIEYHAKMSDSKSPLDEYAPSMQDLLPRESEREMEEFFAKEKESDSNPLTSDSKRNSLKPGRKTFDTSSGEWLKTESREVSKCKAQGTEEKCSRE